MKITIRGMQQLCASQQPGGRMATTGTGWQNTNHSRLAVLVPTLSILQSTNAAIIIKTTFQRCAIPPRRGAGAPTTAPTSAAAPCALWLLLASWAWLRGGAFAAELLLTSVDVEAAPLACEPLA